MAGNRRASSVQERARLQITGTRHGEERTENMPSMVVTLEESKLSGWLNADAYCRASKEGHAVRAGYTGRGEAGGGRQRTQRAEEGATAGWGQGTGRSAQRTCSSCP